MPATAIGASHSVPLHVTLDVPSLADIAEGTLRIDENFREILCLQMKQIANAPDPLLTKAVAAVVTEQEGAQRIACKLAGAGVSADELEALLARALKRDAFTNVARHALRDGLPSALVTLALNVWGFERFVELTGDTGGAAALYGASLGSAIVVLDEVFRHMFEDMTYTPTELAKAIPFAPYLVAATLPLTFRNMVRAIAHVLLVQVGKPQLVAAVDNAIEVGGGVLATATTGHAMERLSLPEGNGRFRGILTRSDLPSVIERLREGPATHAGRLARQAGLAAICGVRDIPAGVCKLATPVGVVTVATLAAFVPAALAVMAATHKAVLDDSPGIPEGAAELARTGVLFSAYVLLAGGSRYAAPAFSRIGAALRSVGGSCLTSASRLASNHFTRPPGWYGFPQARPSHA
jgi:hypothetical protein